MSCEVSNNALARTTYRDETRRQKHDGHDGEREYVSCHGRGARCL